MIEQPETPQKPGVEKKETVPVPASTDEKKTSKKPFLLIGLIVLLLISGITLAVVLRTRFAQETTPATEKGITPKVAVPIRSKITLASGEWAPYTSENLKYEGIASRIVREAFVSQGIGVEYVYLPWKRSIEEAKEGKWHGTFPWLKNEERAQDFYFSYPIAQENVLFFHLKDNDFDWKTIADLEGYKIGGTVGYYYGEEFDEAEKIGQLVIERAAEDAMNIQKLAAKRIDLAICEIDVGYELIEKLFSKEEAEKITHHPKSISTNSLHLLLSKKVEDNDELVLLFNKGLKELNESGKVNQYWEESRQGDYKKE